MVGEMAEDDPSWSFTVQMIIRCFVATFFVCQAIADSLLHSFGQNPETPHSDSVMGDMARTVQLIP